jgi:hypothetical protein
MGKFKNANAKVQLEKCKRENANDEMQSANCKLQIGKCNLQIEKCSDFNDLAL